MLVTRRPIPASAPRSCSRRSQGTFPSPLPRQSREIHPSARRVARPGQTGSSCLLAARFQRQRRDLVLGAPRGPSRPLSRGKAARFTPPRVASRGQDRPARRAYSPPDSSVSAAILFSALPGDLPVPSPAAKPRDSPLRASRRAARTDRLVVPTRRPIPASAPRSCSRRSQGTFPSPLPRQSREIHPSARRVARPGQTGSSCLLAARFQRQRRDLVLGAPRGPSRPLSHGKAARFTPPRVASRGQDRPARRAYSPPDSSVSAAILFSALPGDLPVPSPTAKPRDSPLRASRRAARTDRLVVPTRRP